MEQRKNRELRKVSAISAIAELQAVA